MEDTERLLNDISRKLSQLKCLIEDNVVIGTTELSPPVDEPGLTDSPILWNPDTFELWAWDGDSWEPFPQVEQGLSMGSPIKLGDDVAGAGESGVFTSDRYINQDTFNLDFVGEEDSTQTDIRLLPTGVLEFDKRGEASGVDGDRNGYFVRFKPMDVTSPANFNICNTVTYDQPDVAGHWESFLIGWNVAPGGSKENIATSMMGLNFEHRWQPQNQFSGPREIDEFHLLFTNAAGTEILRPISFMFVDGHEDEESLGAISTPTVQFHVRNSEPYYMQFQNIPSDGGVTRLRMYDPATVTGVTLTMDKPQNLFSISHTGLSNPIIYLNSFLITAVNYLQIQTRNEGTAVRLLGRDAGELVEDIILDSSLDITAGTLSIADTAVTPGTYPNPTSITVNAKGQITAIT